MYDAFARRIEWVPKEVGASPMLVTQAFTVRAYWRVLFCGGWYVPAGKQNVIIFEPSLFDPLEKRILSLFDDLKLDRLPRLLPDACAVLYLSTLDNIRQP